MGFSQILGRIEPPFYSRVDHSATPATSTGSLSAVPCAMMSPGYSTQVCSNLHFLGLRYSWYWQSHSRTRHTIQWYSSRVLVKMRMSLRYTHTIPSAMRLWEMLFIMVWNVARLLVRLKNMTSGSNGPQFVWNAAFHLSL